jgi:hypothetical protein
LKIRFVRSGGFAGPATRIEGEVELEDKPEVRTEKAGYSRSLTPEEARTLRAARYGSSSTERKAVVDAWRQAGITIVGKVARD